MESNDRLRTQRAIAPRVAEQLRRAGFDDAEEIGRGGFGVVYRCAEISLDRVVAVKVLETEFDDDDRTRFVREQRAMAQLTGHPNIVSVLQVGITDDGLPYLVMPYHAHGSLESQIRHGGALPVAAALRLGVKIAGALATAHRLGIVHRDVKPANILFTDYGEPALADFGIAHIAGGFHTATGAITGSPAYTAPEVLSGDKPTPASDVYGLGATLFTALSGYAAYERHSGEQVVAQFVRITSQPAPDLREHGMGEDVSEVVEAAMSADPRRRPSAEALGEWLRKVQAAHNFPVDQMALHTNSPAETREPQPESGSRPETFPAHPGREDNLPVELTSFINRRIELSEVKNLLSASRLVTLTGTGGVGKTRLAVRAAASVRRGFPDGVWLVELCEIQDESLLINVVAATIGLQDRAPDRLQDLLLGFFGPRRSLLVLDNCEHVVTAAAALATTLLPACPELRILATSRESLDVRGEAVMRVDPLTAPSPDWEASLRGLPKYDAVSLFAERAAETVPGFEISESNKADIAGICSRLEGLPLAIELAAARLRTMSPAQILERLTDRYALLTRGSRDVPTRQQTLRWSIDWSYELCTEAEQLLWSRLSVFAGGFELEAVERVCRPDSVVDNPLDILSSLVDKSIVIREETNGVVRFRILETLREYGAYKLRAQGEYVRLGRAHRDWCVQLASDAEAAWISDRQLDWIERLDREQSNLRKAIEFCVMDESKEAADTGLRIVNALTQYWLVRGRFSEARQWLDRVLNHPAPQSSPDRVEALFASSLMAALQGDLQFAAAMFKEIRRIADRTTDPLIHALAAMSEAFQALVRGELPRACSVMETAVEVLETLGKTRLQIAASTILALAYRDNGDRARSTERLQQVLAVTEAAGETVQRTLALLITAQSLWREGSLDRSSQLLRRTLQLNRRLRSPVTTAACLETLAWIDVEQGNHQRAAVLLGATEQLSRSIGGRTATFPQEVDDHDKCVRSARHGLGDERFDAAFRRGYKMSADTAVAFALGDRSAGDDSGADRTTALTKREWQVAELVARGMTNKQIAAKLVISQRTAQGHVEHILTKLGYTSRAQIAAWIVELNMGKD
ncbi:protein kinase domain-containing protein [Nocardia vaccinii]|uniref:protein kinase domain-containing protein n=1 Tax=Nocardia vaccinii TaxID=1822 RepID=UPI0008379878|nr:protein kinase [Nocardia vaccinii]